MYSESINQIKGLSLAVHPCNTAPAILNAPTQRCDALPNLHCNSTKMADLSKSQQQFTNLPHFFTFLHTTLRTHSEFLRNQD